VPTIRPDLLAKIMDIAGLKRAAAYNRVTKKVNETFLPIDQAALAVAADLGINVKRYATREQLAELRQHVKSAPSSPQPVVMPAPTTANSRSKMAKKSVSKKPDNSVFVVHGRDSGVANSMFAFLYSIGLNPIEWTKAIEMTKKGSPHVSTILDKSLAKAKAVVVLLTPDDEAQLRPQFWGPSEPEWEKELRGQARPNVLFEAGLAFGHNPDGTILVEIGEMRPFSDVGGMHTVRLNNSTQSRQQLVSKLKIAGCNPDITGTNWHSVGDFTLKAAPANPTRRKAKRG
jgi:predicted nucleotide-binding protein